MTLTELLNKAILAWWKPRGKKAIKVFFEDYEDYHNYIIVMLGHNRVASINDLLSIESWLLQWLYWEDKRVKEWRVHAMQYATLEEQEKIAKLTTDLSTKLSDGK